MTLEEYIEGERRSIELCERRLEWARTRFSDGIPSAAQGVLDELAQSIKGQRKWLVGMEQSVAAIGPKNRAFFEKQMARWKQEEAPDQEMYVDLWRRASDGSMSTDEFVYWRQRLAKQHDARWLEFLRLINKSDG
jgi:hypothetical protein